MGNERNVSREELKHGAFVAMAVLLVLGLLAAWSVLIPGVMAWDNIVAAVIGSLKLTGPVATAFAAWVAVCRRRACRGRILNTWRALKGPLAILVVVVSAFGATVLVLTLRVVVGDQAGRLLPSGLAVGAAGLALYVIIGWILGWLLPVGITPPLAGFGAFGLFTWLAGSSTWADRLAPATGEPYDLFLGLSPVACTDQTLWLVGISATLLLGWAAIVTRHALTLAAAMLSLLLAGTGMARLLDEPRTVAASDQLAYSCQEWPITVCVHPGMRGGLGELGGAFTTIAARLAGTPAAFNRVEQRSRGDAERTGRGVVPIHVDDLDAGYAERATSEFVEQLAEPCTDSTAAGYRAIVVAWLTGEPLPAGPLLEHQYAAEWFSTLTERQRRDWLRMFYADFTNCRLRSRHFGNGRQGIDPDLATYPVDPSPGLPPTPSPAPSASPSSAVPPSPPSSGPAGNGATGNGAVENRSTRSGQDDQSGFNGVDSFGTGRSGGAGGPRGAGGPGSAAGSGGSGGENDHGRHLGHHQDDRSRARACRDRHFGNDRMLCDRSRPPHLSS